MATPVGAWTSGFFKAKGVKKWKQETRRMQTAARDTEQPPVTTQAGDSASGLQDTGLEYGQTDCDVTHARTALRHRVNFGPYMWPRKTCG
uniref:Uncharacterized protein n=1 Tax=Oryza punctata TaxID=4537 RepID=A0A0E0L909_ORYPU